MENETELETGDMKGIYRDPSIQAILHWAQKSVNASYIGLSGVTVEVIVAFMRAF